MPSEAVEALLRSLTDEATKPCSQAFAPVHQSASKDACGPVKNHRFQAG